MSAEVNAAINEFLNGTIVTSKVTVNHVTLMFYPKYEGDDCGIMLLANESYHDELYDIVKDVCVSGYHFRIKIHLRNYVKKFSPMYPAKMCAYFLIASYVDYEDWFKQIHRWPAGSYSFGNATIVLKKNRHNDIKLKITTTHRDLIYIYYNMLMNVLGNKYIEKEMTVNYDSCVLNVGVGASSQPMQDTGSVRSPR